MLGFFFNGRGEHQSSRQRVSSVPRALFFPVVSCSINPASRALCCCASAEWFATCSGLPLLRLRRLRENALMHGGKSPASTGAVCSAPWLARIRWRDVLSRHLPHARTPSKKRDRAFGFLRQPFFFAQSPRFQRKHSRATRNNRALLKTPRREVLPRSMEVVASAQRTVKFRDSFSSRTPSFWTSTSCGSTFCSW